MVWSDTLSTYVWIFPVGRGNATFIRTALNQGFIIDMGGGSLCNPAQFIRDKFLPYLDEYQTRKIAQVVLSHPHSDHISQCGELETDTLSPKLITCPNDKVGDESVNWSRFGNSEEKLIETYKSLYENRRPPLQTIKFESKRYVPNLEYGIYYIRPPICDRVIHENDDAKYGNSVSILVYYRHGNHTILFPGDMTPEGMKYLLDQEEGVEKRYTIFQSTATQQHPNWHESTSDQPSLRSLLATYGQSILVAPHHGLESCYSQDLYDSFRDHKPQLVVLSERRHSREGDGKTDARYQSDGGASSLLVNVDGVKEPRRSLSTINGHHILIIFSGSGTPGVFADKDPERLLEKM